MADPDTEELVRMEKDYSGLVDEQLPNAEKAAERGELDRAMDILFNLERRTRTVSDTHSLTRVLVAIVQILFKAQAWDVLNEAILALAKRRGQLKQSMARMVQAACANLEERENDAITIKIIETLLNVTEGKIYVEVERARLSQRLALIKECEGKVDEAASIMLDLQVETFGSMDKVEKVKLILEQMRLSLRRKDHVRAQIVSKKINPIVFNDAALDEYRIKYYTYMADLDQLEENYLAVAKHHKALYETRTIARKERLRRYHLKSAVLYTLLAPYSMEQNDYIHRVGMESEIDQIPSYEALLKLFSNAEIIRWKTLREIYETELRLGTGDSPPTDLFRKTEDGEARWQTFSTRVVEHNIRVLAMYYTRITLKRMAQLLEMPQQKTEQILAELVSNKVVDARIDRPAGIVSFVRAKSIEQKLDDWVDNADELLRLITKTTHLVNTEYMVNQHLLAGAKRKA